MDIALAALVAAARGFDADESRLKSVFLALAPLVRETGLILVAAAAILAFVRAPARPRVPVLATACRASYGSYSCARARRRSSTRNYSFRLGASSGTAAAPRGPRSHGGRQWDAVPGSPSCGLRYPFMEGMALIGMVSAFVLAALWLRADSGLGLAWAAALFAVLGVFTQRARQLDPRLGFGRRLLAPPPAPGRQRPGSPPAAVGAALVPRGAASHVQLSGPAIAALRNLFSWLAA